MPRGYSHCAHPCDPVPCEVRHVKVRKVKRTAVAPATPPLQLTFNVPLSGAQQVPPVDTTQTAPVRDAPNSGTVTLTFAPDFSHVDYTLNVQLPENITQAHLHNAAAGANGPIVANLLNNGGTPAAPPAAAFMGNVTGRLTDVHLLGPLAGQTVAALYQLIRDGAVYVNVHSTDFPTGELRGQVFAH